MLDQKFKQELAPINQRLSNLEQGQPKLEQSISNLEQGQSKLSSQVEYLHNKLLDHDEEFKKIRKEAQTYRDEILNSNDRVIIELQMMRSEQIAHLGSHDRMDEALKNHELRIIKLEQPAMAH